MIRPAFDKLVPSRAAQFWVVPATVPPALPLGLVVLGALVASSTLAAAAWRLGLAAAGSFWPGLGIAGLQCLLVPTRADAGAHALSYVFGVTLVGSVSWTALVLVEQWRGTRQLRAALERRRVHQAPRALRKAARRLLCADRLDVVDATEPFAFCYGLLRPRVCASTGLAARLSGMEVEAVLRHERYHLQQCDPAKLAVGRALARALFFLPAVAELLRRYEVARELAADRRVVTEMGGTRPLAGSLYRLLTAIPPAGSSVPGWAGHGAGSVTAVAASEAPPRRRGGAGGAPAGWATLDLRIDHVLEAPTPRLPLVSLPAAAISAASLLLAAAPLLAPGPSRSAAAALVDAHLIPGLC